MDGEVAAEWEDRSIEAAKRVERVKSAATKPWDASASGDVEEARADVEDARMSQQKASASSTTMLWILRDMLWCRDPSNRYSGSVERVERRDGQELGRKMWTCCRAVCTVSWISS
jgi:hypothetical protein